ncbi:RNA polymerase sigma factor [Pseudomonadota bacterium]
MQKAHNYYPDCPEELVVGLARTGDRKAFEDLVRRRQAWLRNLMRRLCSDTALADDLAQQVFLKAWLKIRMLKQPRAFGAWLKRMAVNVWLHYLRKNDALRKADELEDFEKPQHEATSLGMDLDGALATLPPSVRLCVVLSYQEGMSHGEIAKITGFPLGTVKSHIRRGTLRLQELLAAYADQVARRNHDG